MDTHEPLKKQELHSLFNFVLISQAVNPGPHTVPEWAESLKNSSLSKSGFVLKSTLLGSRISRSRQNLMRAFRENHKKVDFLVFFASFSKMQILIHFFFKIIKLIELLV